MEQRDAAGTASNDWSNLSADHPLSQFSAKLPSILEKAGYDEMYGIDLVAPHEAE